jgi:hypothetical protein
VNALREFHYRALFPSRSLLPGAHVARVGGAGMDIAGTVPLARARDPRRLDLRAALRDPFGQWWAHEYRQRSLLQVLLLVDLSASMRAAHGQRVGAFARALQHSVLKRGDAFGVVGFAEGVKPEFHAPPSRSRQAGEQVLDRLDAAGAFDGRSAQGVTAAARLAPRGSALVFLLSDFLFTPAWLDEALAELSRHDVVPVWLEHDAPQTAASGLLELRDAESRAWRSLWMRPALARRWAEAQQAHESAVRECMARHQRVPLRIGAHFDADAVSDFFAARV